VDDHALAADRLLADHLARVLSAEPFGLSCAALVARVQRRRGDVLRALRADGRFDHHGRTRGSRWRLAAQDRMGRNGARRRADAVPWAGLDPSGVPLVGRRPESGS
jgi:hypothetical protein